MPMDHLAFLNKLSELGVEFCVPIPSEWGRETHVASIEELLQLVEDPISLYAKHHGVSKADYRAWANDDFSVRCAARTVAGRPCKHVATGGSHVPAKTWVEMQGAYCNVHGEGREL